VAVELALVHEWLEDVGGSENVFWALVDQFPEADRWCLWDNRRTREPAVSETWLGRTPLRRSKMAALPLMPLAWSTQRSPRYDVVLSSSHSFAHTVRFPSSRQAAYLTYVHTPARYVWSPELDHRGASPLVAVGAPALRRVDHRLARRADSVAVNSVEVQERVLRHWGQESVVIHPPVDVDFFAVDDATTAGDLPAGLPHGFALAAGRWVSYKRFDAAIRAAAVGDVPLVLAGAGPEEQHLRGVAADCGAHVTFVPNPTRAVLRALYRRADVFVFPGHEDFGIMPVEAQAAGTPVAGLGVGGLLETVVPGVTGALTQTVEPQELAAAIEAAAGLKGSAAPAQQAQLFHGRVFAAAIAQWLESATSSTRR
jgi:glycosyltransferase involved in cell wall biosynthesis